RPGDGQRRIDPREGGRRIEREVRQAVDRGRRLPRRATLRVYARDLNPHFGQDARRASTLGRARKIPANVHILWDSPSALRAAWSKQAGGGRELDVRYNSEGPETAAGRKPANPPSLLLL